MFQIKNFIASRPVRNAANGKNGRCVIHQRRANDVDLFTESGRCWGRSLYVYRFERGTDDPSCCRPFSPKERRTFSKEG